MNEYRKAQLPQLAFPPPLAVQGSMLMEHKECEWVFWWKKLIFLFVYLANLCPSRSLISLDLRRLPLTKSVPKKQSTSIRGTIFPEYQASSDNSTVCWLLGLSLEHLLRTPPREKRKQYRPKSLATGSILEQWPCSLPKFKAYTDATTVLVGRC